MKWHPPTTGLHRPRRSGENGSVLIIVLWISLGLVSIALYFANSMNYELQAADNRVSGLESEQAIEGAARYVGYALQQYATNGAMPDSTQFHCEGVPIGDSKFWVIGRDPNNDSPTELTFGLVDEGAKLNLNNVSTNVFQFLPNISSDFAEAIMDWRGTNGVVDLDYAASGYAPKNAPFETVDELRLVYGATTDMLVGDDVNRNGILDGSEKSQNSTTGGLDPGLFGYVTVYTREPNFHSDGTSLTNINTAASASALQTAFQDANINNASGAAAKIYSYMHPTPTGGNSRTRAATPATTIQFKSFFDFCVYGKNNANMSTTDMGQLVNYVTISTNLYFRGRVNVNTACSDVLIALFMGLNIDESTAESAAQTLIAYRQQNPENLSSVAWVIDALGNNSSVVTALRAGEYITTHSYQFSADIAAVGAYGRGYRRVKFVFDVSDGAPKIIYRQDLSRLGWALGDKIREDLVANNTQ